MCDHLDWGVRPVGLVGLLVLFRLAHRIRFVLDHFRLLLGGLLVLAGLLGGVCGGCGDRSCFGCGGVVLALLGLVDVVEARLLLVEAVAVLG